MSNDPSTIERILADRFPPEAPLPHAQLCRDHREWLAREARGLPGDVVTPGLFPSPRIKNARLLLTIAGDVWPSRALERARNAYGRSRSHLAAPASYHAHDAVACALVEPSLPRGVKTSLIRHLCADTAQLRGWRSRRKTWQLWRWAAARGLVDGPVDGSVDRSLSA